MAAPENMNDLRKSSQVLAYIFGYS